MKLNCHSLRFLLLLFVTSSLGLISQNNTEKKDNFKISGGLGATQTFYNVNGIENRRDPYFWLVNANLNISIKGINIPFTASFSQQNKRFTQPFNQYGISPKIKSVIIHAGYRSLLFSNFTYNGLVFLGGGIEYNPTNSWVKLATFAGRFTKPVSSPEKEGLVSGVPAYGRWGGGLKLTIGKPANFVDIIAFKAKDILGSKLIYDNDSNLLKAAENLTGAIYTNQKIGKKFTFASELAFSAYNADQLAPEQVLLKYSYVNNFGTLFTPNSSSQFNKAMLANLIYQEKFMQIRFSYRRIDPEYKSLGCIFLNNDLEDITSTLSTRLFKNKVNLSVSGGIQRNNLNGELSNQMNRVIGSANLSYSINSSLNLSANVSNFNSSNVAKRVNGPDSLNYSQVTNSGGLNLNYSIGNNSKRQNIFLMTNVQTANDNQNKSNTFYNANFGYQLNLAPKSTIITASLTTNKNASSTSDNASAGLNAGLVKHFFAKKMRLNASTAYLINFIGGKQNGSSQIFRLIGNYTLNKHHSFSADLNILLKNSTDPSSKSFQEYRGSLIYNFTF